MLWKTTEKMKRARAAAVILVSDQSKAPEPRITLTIWARKTINSAAMGKDQKIICLNPELRHSPIAESSFLT